MSKQPVPIAMVPTPHDGSGEECEVGRITLGGRDFGVVLVPARSRRPRDDEICRFEIDGSVLAVVGKRPAGHGHDRAHDLAARLTSRELQIAVLVAQGHATKNIAYRLQISEWTVSTYLKRVFAKLNVDSRAAMVYRCAPLINAMMALESGQRGAAFPETRRPSA